MRPARPTEKNKNTEFYSVTSFGGGGLLNVDTSNANIPIEVEEGVLLSTYTVGEVDCRAVG